MKRQFKVLMPDWWTETTKPIVGYTDGIATRACSAETLLYVVVPEFEYEGYFKMHDLKLIKKELK